MFFDPRELFFLAVLVGVTGWVLRGLMVTWHRLYRSDPKTTASSADIEERLRKLEAATTSIIVDMSSMNEKHRFMARLQAGIDARERAAKADAAITESDISPMSTQSIPIMPRARSPRL